MCMLSRKLFGTVMNERIRKYDFFFLEVWSGQGQCLGAAWLIGRVLQAELEAAKKFLYQEMGYRSRSEQLTKTSEINLDYQEVMR